MQRGAQGSRRIQGYLWKEGKSTKRWRRRWFAYVPGTSSLAYYEYSDDRKELGSILLSPSAQVFPDSDNSYRNSKVTAEKQKWIFHIRNTVKSNVKEKSLSSSSSSSSSTLTLTPKRHQSPTPTGDSPPSDVSVSTPEAQTTAGEQVVYHLMAATENEMWFWIAGLQHVKLQGSREQLQTSRARTIVRKESASISLDIEVRSPRTPGGKASRLARMKDIDRAASIDALAAFEEDDEELEDLTFEDLSIATTASYMKYQETQRVAAEAMEAGQLDEGQDLARLVALEDALVQGHKELVVARREVKQKDQEIHILHKHLQGYYQELKSTMAKLEDEKQRRRELAIVSGSGGIYVSEDDSEDEEEGAFDHWIDDYDMEKAELVEANNLLRQELRDIKTQLLKENTERMRLQKENKDLRAALVYGERPESDDELSGNVTRERGVKGMKEKTTKATNKRPTTKRNSGSDKKVSTVKKGANGENEKQGEKAKAALSKAHVRQHASYSSLQQMRGQWKTEEEQLQFSGTVAATERDFRNAMRVKTTEAVHHPPTFMHSSSSASNLRRSEEYEEEAAREALKRSRSEQMPPAFWVPDEDALVCENCSATFGLLTRRHHCRVCGRVFCSRCCSNWIGVHPDRFRACDDCATGCNT